MSRPTVIDLFSGAGGMSEGFIQAGYHIVASVEKDKEAVLTQKVNHCFWKKKYRTEIIQENLINIPTVIEKFSNLGITTVDVIIGGPPCQGFTRTNQQTRTRTNPLNSLFTHFADLVYHFKPKFFVMENVADLEKFDNGEVCKEIIKRFWGIGYRTKPKVLNALHYGVPQNRNRIFFLGTRLEDEDIVFPTPTNDSNSAVSVWDAISDLPRLSPGATEDELEYLLVSPENRFQKRMRVKTNGKVRNNIVTRNNELVLERYKHIPQGGNWKNIPDYLMTNYKNKLRCHNWIYRRLQASVPSVAITHFRKNMLIHPEQDRGLSVREAARLQSFPDHFRFMGGIGAQQQQVANAVPPLLAKAVAKSVKQLLDKR